MIRQSLSTGLIIIKYLIFMRKFFSKQNVFSSIVSITLSVVFVASVTFAATTISTNIQTDGTLSVTGAVTTSGAVTLGDAAVDAIIVTGNASTTAALTVGGNFYIGGHATTTAASGDFTTTGNATTSSLYAGGNLNVNGMSTTSSAGNISTQGGLTVGNATANTLAGTILFSAQSSDPTGVTQGTIYYNSTSKVLKLFDGTNWFTTGTTTSGISLSGARLQLADLTTQFMALGTSSTLVASPLLTLEATSTGTVPLTIAAKASQTADLLGIRNSDNAKLLYITSAGALFGSSTLQATGAMTTYGNVTLGDAASDVIILTGNASTTNALTVGGNFYIGGRATTTASTGALELIGNLSINGLATTTASTGTFSTFGKFGAGTSTSPTWEVTADGTATTTVALSSSAASTGGCIQIKATNGVAYRMYVNADDVATTTANRSATIRAAFWELGVCK